MQAKFTVVCGRWHAGMGHGLLHWQNSSRSSGMQGACMYFSWAGLGLAVCCLPGLPGW